MRPSKKRKNNSLPSTETSPKAIPGLSENTSALLLRTIKIYKKYLSAKNKAVPVVHHNTTCAPKNNDDALINGAEQNFQSAILDRMGSLQQGRDDKFQSLFRECEETAQTLLDHLGRTDSNRKWAARHAVDNKCLGTQEEEEEIVIRPDAAACLNFLMDMIQDVECKTILRRAAICVTNILTKGRDDCHSYIASTHLRTFTRTIGDAKKTSKDESKTNIVRMQEDGLRMLDTMSNYHSTFQPKLRIACRFLEEQKGIRKRSIIRERSESTDRVAINVVDLRKMRDIAIKHGRKEVRKVKQIVKCLDECFYVLVPRFGHCTVENQTGTSLTDDAEDDDSIDWEDGDDIEDDNVDWEDGDDTIEETSGELPSTISSNKQDSHSIEVDKTLAVMKRSGIFKNGSLAVPIGNDLSQLLTSKAQPDHTIGNWKKDLVKYVNLLSKRHAPRITEWVHALTTADMMVESKDEKHGDGLKTNGSLIVMPASKRIQKGEILQALMKTKREIARALSLASKVVPANEADVSKLKPLTTRKDEDITNLKKRGIEARRPNDDNFTQPLTSKQHRGKISKKKTLQIRLRK
jgi:hypothetical protein